MAPLTAKTELQRFRRNIEGYLDLLQSPRVPTEMKEIVQFLRTFLTQTITKTVTNPTVKWFFSKLKLTSNNSNLHVVSFSHNKRQRLLNITNEYEHVIMCTSIQQKIKR